MNDYELFWFNVGVRRLTPTYRAKAYMEEFITDKSNYFYILLVFFVAWFFSRRIKYKKLDKIASRLNAKRNGNFITGKKNNVEYTILFQDGYSGGSASGPGTAGHKSIVRIIVEKKTNYNFELDSQNVEDVPENLKNKIGTEGLLRLFESLGVLFPAACCVGFLSKRLGVWTGGIIPRFA